jgi:hypothetical protein
MTPSTKLSLYWTPRVLSILFACFISIFALDVFGEAKDLWQLAQALFMHLIPTLLVIAVLVISWRHEWFGGIVYVGLAAVYVIGMWGRFDWTVYVLMAGPLLVMGALFMINWVYRAELRPAS